ncbi:cellulose synthase complex periplasmic endoglucanase BcsZ [Limnobacter humi]|uniref:cellulase n=1 Tax=Limnobacter humi TaxID=1778671 RepID=A0ABT1WEE3_9BURK|nr:cellulose synthase complex periplasmic endoglucanase BcsZ [Limnobacter humi]MCQ8895416.1 cellulose synthase complex periplasmic endoglucanase BcsZ [Limnobacter humi]
MGIRRFLGLVCGLTTVCALTTACQAANRWPAWEGYQAAFISDDGRVIDRSQEDLRTVSEGQAYAMFFALVAGDQTRFNQLLKWTEDNLAKGDIRRNLPAWIWGRQAEQWGVLDANSASDADLWITYVLWEAGRLWCNPGYQAKAQALGQRILQQETLTVEGLGLSVLPGPQGFVADNGTVRLNPSYVPPFLMMRLAQVWPDDARWAQLYLGSQQLLLASVRQGAFPDWAEVRQGQVVWAGDDLRGDYDAIRTYLWIGLTPATDPIQGTLKQQTRPVLNLVKARGNMPEWFTGTDTVLPADHPGPAGFQVATAPFAASQGEPALAQALLKQGLQQAPREQWVAYGYYNASLTLFGEAAMNKRFNIGPQGELLPAWKGNQSCS